MKKFFMAFTLIIFCTRSILFSMDPATTLNTNDGLSEDQIIIRIDEAINQKYSLHYLLDPFKILLLEEMLDIIHMAQTHYPHITDNAINKLCDCNLFFKQSIDHFIIQASQNLEKITANNIKTIENPKNHQPTDELNQLPLLFKTYVMDQALERTSSSYNIVLKEHRNAIITFDISEYTDQAITSSFDHKSTAHISRNYDSQLILWNLKTGKSIHNFSESDPIAIITFSPNGSHIAGALYTENAIKVWSTQTKQLLHKLFSTHSITHLGFSYPTGFILTALSYSNDERYERFINQWLLTSSNNKAGELINSSYCFGHEQNRYFNGTKYRVSHPCTYIVTPKTGVP